MRRRAAAAAALLFAVATPGALAVAPASAAPQDCRAKRGADVTQFWPQTRLDFTRAWSISTGRNVVVGVVDSGLNVKQPQLKGVDVRAGESVIDAAGFSKGDTQDCDGHGTGVTSIIAAQRSASSDFVGVAPDATIVPIKQANKRDEQGPGGGTSEGIGRGIEAAMSRGATVVNVSIATPEPTPELEAAVADARRRNVVIVAAAGNDRQDNQTLRPAYPAAYATKYHNVIAVSATDINDAVAPFSDSGTYVTVAAPGVKVPFLAGFDRGFAIEDGTSFATPFVTGTVALLRAAYPTLKAPAIRDRIAATADAPPDTVPSRTYGAGIVNPYLAMTSVGDAGVTVPPAAKQRPLPAPHAAPGPDRSLQHVALASAVTLFGLTVLAVAVAMVLRRRTGERRSDPDTGTG